MLFTSHATHYVFLLPGMKRSAMLLICYLSYQLIYTVNYIFNIK